MAQRDEQEEPMHEIEGEKKGLLSVRLESVGGTSFPLSFKSKVLCPTLSYAFPQLDSVENLVPRRIRKSADSIYFQLSFRNVGTFPTSIYWWIQNQNLVS